MNNRLLVPRATGGFNPSGLAGLEIWLDASKASTVTLNGTTVSQWRDARPSSSQALNQASAGLQPTWVASSRNGLSGINFPANTIIGDATSPAFNFSQPTTYFTVFQSPTSSGPYGFFDGSIRQHVFGNTATEAYLFAGSFPAPATIVGSTFYAAIFIFNGAASSYRFSTKAATTVDAGSNAIDRLFIGSNSGLRGDVNEFGMFSRAVSDAEAETLLAYLGQKWAITIA
jgi:hypothetical protein